MSNDLYFKESEMSPITVEWDDADKRVLRYTYPEIWTWDDVFLIIEKGDALLDEVTSKVFIIIDLSLSKTLPPNALPHGRNILKRSHPNRGIYIVIGMNKFIQTMFETFMQLFGTLVSLPHTAQTLEEARAFVNKYHNLINA